MPRVLIAGCGYLGQAIADLFAADGWDVEAWTNTSESAQKLSAKGYFARPVDISDAKQIGAANGNFDAVVHSASTRGGDVDLYRRVYLNGARNLLDQFADSRILFVSSTSVYAQTGGEEVTEQSPAQPRHDTGKILLDAENLVLARGVVIRLGGIYGPGRSALLRKFLNGEATIDLENDRFANQIHRDDAAAAIRLLIKSAHSAGEVYNAVDNEPIRLSECYRWLASKLNRPIPSTGSSSARKRGDSNKRVSNAKLRAVSWTPKYPTFALGMEKSVLPNLPREGA